MNLYESSKSELKKMADNQRKMIQRAREDLITIEKALNKEEPTLKEVSYLKEGKEYLVYHEYSCMFIGKYKKGNFIISLTNEYVTRHDEQRYFEVQI